MKSKWRSLLWGYGVGIVSTLVATGVHLWARPYLGSNVPYITFFPAIFVTAVLSRLGPTLLAVLLSGISAAVWFIPPDDSPIPATNSAWAGMVLFAISGVLIAVLSERMHRKADQVKRERERFFVTLSSIGDGVIVTNANACVEFMNSVAEQLTGWQLTEARGQQLAAVFRTVEERSPVVDDSASAVAKLNNSLGKTQPHVVLLAKDGKQRFIQTTASPIRDQSIGVLGAVWVFRDISQQRASQLVASRLAALVDSSEDAIIGQTFDGQVTDWNSGAEKLFGFTADEAVGSPIFATIVPADRRNELLQVLKRVQRGEGGQQFDTIRKCRDGRMLPVSVRISPILDSEGTAVGVSAIDRDISRQRALERRRNARLSVTQLLARQGDMDNAIREVLAAVCLSLEWEIGCFWQLVPELGVMRCRQFWQNCSRDVEVFRTATLDLTVDSRDSLPGRVWKDGKPIWIGNLAQQSGFPRAELAGDVGLCGGFACPVAVGEEVIGVVEWFSSEIQQPDEDLLEMMATIGGQVGQFIERCEAEQRLRRSEEELRDFFENATLGLHWVGADGTILRVNQAELDLLGYTRDEYLGRHIAEFHSDRAVIEDILRRLKDGEELHDYPARLRCKDGTVKHVLIDSNALWQGDEFVHSRCFTRDVTDKRRAEASLRESEERLRLALDAGRMGNWAWNIDSGEVTWSPVLEEIHGLATGEFDGTFEAYQKDIHPEDRERVLSSIRQTLESGQNHHLEYRIVWPDASVHWLEARGKLFRDDNGRPVRIVGVCSDVTQRKHLEQLLQTQLDELSDAESRIRSVVDNVIDGIITLDGHGVVNSLNPAAERLFGYPSSEIVGKNIRLLLPHAWHDGHDYLGPTLQSDVGIADAERETVGRRKDGSTFPLDLAIGEFHFGHQKYYTGIVRDITERKNLEQSLRFLAEASKSLSALVDYKTTLQKLAQLAVPAFADWCAVDILDAEGELQRLAVAHVDPEKVCLAEELYERYPPSPDEPHGIQYVLRTGVAELVKDLPDSLLENAAHDEEHLQILRELQLKSYICVPLRAQSHLLGTLTFVMAESGRHYTDDDLTMAEDLANRAVVAIENARLYQKVREADRRKDEFLAMLAHELRNPLVPIRSGLDILGMDAGAHQETITLMQEQVEHIVRLVDDLLDVSRIMRDKVELRKEPVELATLVRRSVETVRSLIDNRGHQLIVSIPPQPIWLVADSVRLVQVIENLLTNASKYMDAQGTIELSAEAGDGLATIRVRDTGIGIEPELLPNVFELFTQSSRSLDRSQGGLGIGLTLVQRLVELHGGSVSAASDGLGHGSVFEIQLPLADAPIASQTLAEHPEANSQARRILVVDDNRGAAWLVAKLLQKLGDHKVETAADGQSALDKIKQMHPHIVLLDIGLPGMDGYEVGSLIREDPAYDDVLLIALTGYGQEEDRQKSKRAGFDEHLVKPPSVDQLKVILSHPKLPAATGELS